MQLVRGYAVLANGGYLVEPYFITKIEYDSGNTLFVTQPEVCRQRDLPVLYGDTQRSMLLSDENVENVAMSQESNNGNVPRPQLEQVTPAQVQQEGDQQYAPHVISSQLAFLLQDALN